MTAQQMLEHLETTLLYSIGEQKLRNASHQRAFRKVSRFSIQSLKNAKRFSCASSLPEDGTLPELKYKNLSKPKRIF